MKKPRWMLDLTDPLTSLPNSRYLDVYFERELEKAKHFRFPLVVLAMDLDGFKAVNDRFGHHVGDMMLLEVAKVLNRSVRASYVVIRYGGGYYAGISIATRSNKPTLGAGIQITDNGAGISVSAIRSATLISHLTDEDGLRNVLGARPLS